MPLPVTIGWPERLRSCLGALIGLSFTAGLMHVTIGDAGMMPLLVAPMGASAVLLFAVPASPLAQPWSIIGGNVTSAFLGVLCARIVTNPIDAAPLAVAFSIAAMFALRCVHPPSGAVALTAVLGGPSVHALGFGFVVAPIAFQSFALLAVALAFHAATGHRYPHALRARKKTVRTPLSSTAPGFAREDLQVVLGRRNELLDIDPGDLDALLIEVQLQSYLRTFTGMRCSEIMSSPAITVPITTSVHGASILLRRHNVKALPVVDDASRVIGIVTRADIARGMSNESRWFPMALLTQWLTAKSGSTPTVAAIMTPDVSTVTTLTPIAELVPIFVAFGHHHIPVLDPHARLAGMITQADFILALYRHSPISTKNTI